MINQTAMYAEQSTTGINLMDLSPREVLIIRDSLNGSTQRSYRILCLEEKKIIEQIVRKIEQLPGITPPKYPWTNL